MPPHKIMVVEDEHIVREDLVDCLRQLGYDVVAAASSGAEALAKAAAARPDLVLMDIRIKGPLDGIDTAGQLRRQLGTPVIYLTAHADEQTLVRARETQPLGYLVKPFEESAVKAAIEMALHKHQLDVRLAASEQWLATTLGSMGDAVLATDRQGNVVFLNRIAEMLTGWTQAQAVGRPSAEVFVLLDTRTRTPLENPVAGVLASGEPLNLPEQVALLARDGTWRLIDDSACPIHGDGGEVVGVVLVFRDITERLRLAESLRQMQKLEAIGRLAGGVAHDFNNLLTIINGYSDVLLADLEGADPAFEILSEIRAAGERAAGLTRQLLAFGRKQVIAPLVFDVNALVRQLDRSLGRLLGEAIALSCTAASEPLEVRADPAQVEQILLNLAVNARDAMPTGGQLTIATAARCLDRSSAALPEDVLSGNYAELTVSDTGVGIAPEVVAHLFEPFFTTKEVGRGTGLGLAAVYGIVKQSGGHLEVESQPGTGTTFRIFLPQVAIEDQPQPANVASASPGNETILVVEDDALVRRVIVRMLDVQGYQVLEAGSGSEALTCSRQHSGRIDLLLSDVLLPDTNGNLVAQQLLAERPRTPVLFMSGYSGGALDFLGELAAGAQLLEKPFKAETLVRKVRQLLDGRSVG
ncbi:MAG: response regulator [Pirellulaceae bacterium]